MIDNYNPEDFERLKQEVETLVGRSVKTPKDFEFLSRQIEGYTNETISVSTLKRMWGYVASPCKPSKYNLNLLSRMIGYSDWEAFSGGNEVMSSSRFFVKSKLIADALQKGEQVRLTWCPGRVLTIIRLSRLAMMEVEWMSISTVPSASSSRPLLILPLASWSLGNTSTVTSPPDFSSIFSANSLAVRVSLPRSVPLQLKRRVTLSY